MISQRSQRIFYHRASLWLLLLNATTFPPSNIEHLTPRSPNHPWTFQVNPKKQSSNIKYQMSSSCPGTVSLLPVSLLLVGPEKQHDLSHPGGMLL